MGGGKKTKKNHTHWQYIFKQTTYDKLTVHAVYVDVSIE